MKIIVFLLLAIQILFKIPLIQAIIDDVNNSNKGKANEKDKNIITLKKDNDLYFDDMRKKLDIVFNSLDNLSWNPQNFVYVVVYGISIINILFYLCSSMLVGSILFLIVSILFCFNELYCADKTIKDFVVLSKGKNFTVHPWITYIGFIIGMMYMGIVLKFLFL